MRAVEVLLRIRGDATHAMGTLREMQNSLRAVDTSLARAGGATARTGLFGGLQASARSLADTMRQTFMSVQQSTSGIEAAFWGIARGAFAINAVIYLVERLAMGVKQLGTLFIGANVDLESYVAQYHTLLGSLEAANARIAQLQEMNLTTPFDLPELIEADRLLTVFGARTERTMNAIMNSAAAVNQPIEEVAFWFGRIAAADFGQAFHRLSEMGIVTRTMLQDMGLAFDSRGAFQGSAEQAIEAVTTIMEDRFAEAAIRMSQTFQGLASNISDRIFQLRAVMGAPIFDVVKAEMIELFQLLARDDVQTGAGFIGQAIAAGLQVGINAVQEFMLLWNAVVGLVTSGIDSLTGGFASFAGMILAAVAPLGNLVDQLVAGNFAEAGAIVGEVMANIVTIAISMIDDLAVGLAVGGWNAVVALADGMMDAAATYVMAAINFITSMISSFLQGFSPPKKGPLSTIDKWFPPILNAYLGSWQKADWDILTDITDFVADAFERLVEDGRMSAEQAGKIVVGTQGVAGLNQMVTDMIEHIRETGQVSAEGLLKIQQLLGSQNKDIFEQLRAKFESAALDKQIRDLQRRLSQLDAAGGDKVLQNSIDAAEEAIKNARNPAQYRQARMQLDMLKQQQRERDRQKDQIQNQINLLKEQKDLLEDQQAGYDAFVEMREREIEFLEKIVDLEEERLSGGKKAKDWADAQWRYNFHIADSATQLEMLRGKLGEVEHGSDDYFEILTQIYDLEKELREEQLDKAEEAARAQWEYNYALADTEEKLRMQRERLAGMEEGSAEWWDARKDIADLEDQQADEAKAREEAEWDYYYAIASNEEKAEMLRKKIGEVGAETEEGYQLRKQLFDIEQQIAAEQLKNQESAEDEAEARRKAHLAYQMQLADTAGKIALMREELKRYEEGSVEYWQTLTQIAQLEDQLAREQAAAAKKGAAGGGGAGKKAGGAGGAGANMRSALGEAMADAAGTAGAAGDRIKAAIDKGKEAWTSFMTEINKGKERFNSAKASVNALVDVLSRKNRPEWLNNVLDTLTRIGRIVQTVISTIMEMATVQKNIFDVTLPPGIQNLSVEGLDFSKVNWGAVKDVAQGMFAKEFGDFDWTQILSSWPVQIAGALSLILAGVAGLLNLGPLMAIFTAMGAALAPLGLLLAPIGGLFSALLGTIGPLFAAMSAGTGVVAAFGAAFGSLFTTFFGAPAVAIFGIWLAAFKTIFPVIARFVMLSKNASIAWVAWHSGATAFVSVSALIADAIVKMVGSAGKLKSAFTPLALLASRLGLGFSVFGRLIMTVAAPFMLFTRNAATAARVLTPFGTAIMGLVRAFGGLVLPLLNVVRAFGMFIPPLLGLLGPLALVAAPILAIVAGIAALAVASPKFNAILNEWTAKLGNWVLEALPGVMAGLNTLVSNVLNWIGTAAPGIGSKLLEWANAFGTWWSQAWPIISAGLSQLGTTLLTWIVAYGPTILATLGTWALAFIGWIASMIPGFLEGLAGLGVAFYEWISEKAGELVEWFVPWAQSIIAWIPGAIVEFLNAWPTLLDNFLTWIADQAGPILKQLGDWAVSFLAWIIPLIPDLIVALVGLAAAVLVWIVETAIVLGDKLINEWGPAFVKWVNDEAIPKLGLALEELWKKVESWIGTAATWVSDKFVKEWVPAALKWADDVNDKVADELDEVKNKIGSWVTEKAGDIKTTFLTIGSSIVSGIQTGIGNAWQGLLNFINGKLALLPKTVREFLGIGSPSKVMAKIGKWIPPGLEEGIEEGWPSLMDSVNGMADDLVQVFVGLKERIGIALDGIGSVFTPGLPEGFQKPVEDIRRKLEASTASMQGVMAAATSGMNAQISGANIRAQLAGMTGAGMAGMGAGVGQTVVNYSDNREYTLTAMDAQDILRKIERMNAQDKRLLIANIQAQMGKKK